DALLRTITDRAILLAGADRGALLLSGPDGALEAAIARNAEGFDLSPDQVLTRSLPDRVLGSGRAVLLTDTASSPGTEPMPASVVGSALRSVLCVPLPGPQAPLGVLYVDGRLPAEQFGPAELAVFEALAAHGALAIERERLREEQAQHERQVRLR